MNKAEDTAQLQALFVEALELDETARASWLAALRQRNPQMAGKVARLLELDAKQVDPFSQAIDSVRETLDVTPAQWIGRDVGGFRLLSVLGQGGMGTVFLAERQMRDFQQQVALKLLRGRWLGDGALEHFAAERRILARLHHPNIASLIDAGTTPDARPFMAMEYIDGVPLRKYCDQERLSVRARVQLLRDLLGALGHAHRSLVVHRDLKPGNVLVTGDGTLKLLDFGIARLIEADATSTSTSTRVFTPEYASPEQLDGRPIGPGSDLYSFGLLLYELCAGVLPWGKAGRSLSDPAVPMTPSQRLRKLDAGQTRQIAEHRHSDARRLARSVRGDLGRIVMRCLETDPAKRYASAQELDADLAAWLQGRPPSGIQVPRHERTLAFARRHAWPLAAAALLLLAASALLVQALISQHRLSVERDRAVAAADKARMEAQKSQHIASFVQSMLAGVDPDRAHGMDRSLMRLLLDSAAQRAKRELASQPAVRSAIERTIATSYDSIGEYAPAIHHFDLALKAAAEARLKPEERLYLQVAKARSTANLGQMDKAVSLIRKAIADASSLPPDSRNLLFARATAAGFDCDQGKLKACRQGYIRVLARQRSALGDTDPDTEVSMLGLAYADTNLAHFADAQDLYKNVVRRYRKQYGEGNSRTLNAINGLAVSYLQSKHYAEAEALLRPALKQAEKVFGPNHPITLSMSSNLGGAIRQQPGRNAEALPYYRHALKAAQELSGEDSERTVYGHINLALLLRDAGDLAGAERQARTAVAHSTRALGANSPYRAMVLDKLASILIRERKYREAHTMLDKAWHIFATHKSFGPDHPEVQAVIGHYVELFAATNQPARATHWRKMLIAQTAQDSAK